MIALKEISKVICVCVNLGYGEWERLYFRKVSLRKGQWIGEGAESRKPLKPEMPVIFGSSFSHTPCNYQLGLVPSSEYMLLSFVWPSPFVVAPVTAFLNRKSLSTGPPCYLQFPLHCSPHGSR